MVCKMYLWGLDLKKKKKKKRGVAWEVIRGPRTLSHNLRCGYSDNPLHNLRWKATH